MATLVAMNSLGTTSANGENLIHMRFTTSRKTIIHRSGGLTINDLNSKLQENLFLGNYYEDIDHHTGSIPNTFCLNPLLRYNSSSKRSRANL